MEILEKLAELKRLQKTLKEVKAAESELRDDLADELHPRRVDDLLRYEAPSETVSVKGNLIYTLAITSADIGKLSVESNDCIIWKPTLNRTKYKELDRRNQVELSRYLTIKQGKATISFKEHK